MGGLGSGVEAHVVDRPLPRVEVELEGQRPPGLGEQTSPIDDQLELAGRTGQLTVAELGGQRASGCLVERTLHDHRNVDVADPWLVPAGSG